MVLYHASQGKNLKLIKPQRTMSNNKYIGDYVFATKNKKMAVMYLVPKGVPTLMNPKNPSPNIVICADEAEFLKQDQGGAIYELPAEEFFESPQEGLSEYEMVSQKSIKPLNKTVFTRTLDALLSVKIKVRFTDEQTFKDLIQNSKQLSRD